MGKGISYSNEFEQEAVNFHAQLHVETCCQVGGWLALEYVQCEDPPE